MGMAALLSGSERYWALDVVSYANPERNLEIFDGLVDLFTRRVPIPDEDDLSEVQPALDSYAFPEQLLTAARLQAALAPARLARLREAIRSLVLLLAPMTPHIAEELWASMGESYSIHQQRWPSYNATLARAELVTLVLQVDGKVRDRIQVPSGLTDAKAKEMALDNEKVRRFMDGRQVADIVVVPGRLVNVVTK